MIPAYVLTREGKEASKPQSLFALGLRLRVFGRGGDNYLLSHEGGLEVQYPTLGAAVSACLNWLRKMKVGQALHFTTRKGTAVLRTARVAVVDWTPKPAATSGSDQVDLYVGCLNELWGDKWRSAGALVCKKVAGTMTWSDHAWGEAQDLFATWEVMDEITAWTVANATELNVKYVILRNKIWEAKRKRWTNYTGVYHRHVHVSFNHDGAGTPPCAR